MSIADITAARDWLADCEWADIDGDGIAELSDAQVIRAVARHYDGGIDGFMTDAS